MRPQIRGGAALLALVLALAGLAPGGSSRAAGAQDRTSGPVARPATRILDQEGARRLLANKGLTLQWIDWDHRGALMVSREAGVWKLHGRQADANGPGLLALDGTITEIGADYFTFQGRISITNTPDPGRACSADRTWRFAVTQNRRYYRLREFEWCDDLTDYVDIYF